MTRRRPWYGFLYYVLGAQGTFFAWLIAIFGVTLTYREALLYVLNPSPTETSVEEVLDGQTGYARWIEVKGVEADLGPLSDLSEATPPGGEDTVLIDPGSRQAVALRTRLSEVRARREALARTEAALARDHGAEATVTASEAPAAAEGEAPGSTDAEEAGDAAPPRDTALEDLEDLLEDDPDLEALLARRQALVIELESEISDAMRDGHQIERALVVVLEGGERPADRGERRARRSADEAAAAATAADPMFERLRARTEERVTRLERAIRPDVTRIGLLTPMPDTRQELYQDRHGVSVGGFALVAGHRPNELFAWLCAGFLLLLLFLVAGLFAVWSPQPRGTEEPPAA